MSVKTATVTYGPNGDRNAVQVVWVLANGDTGVPFEAVDFNDCTVQITGTFGAGGSVTWQGSNDATNYSTLTDPQGNAITKTSAAFEQIEESPRYQRPNCTAGDGTTALTITLWALRPKTLSLISNNPSVTGLPSTLLGLPKVTVCYPEWFGARADGTTDCTVALQACAQFAADAGYIKIQLSPGTYKVTATVYANGANAQSFMAPTWLGVERTRDNTLATNIDGSSLGAGVPVLKFRGASGRTCSGYMENIRVVGSGTSVGIMIQGLGGYQFRRMNYDNHAVGVMAHNEDASSFTEYVTCEDCDWRSNVTTAFQWKVTSGNNSFHGTGLTKRCTINASATGPVFQILTGCNVYNAPLNAQVWSTTGAITIVQNDTTGAPTPAGFVGELSLEVSASFVTTLAANKVVYFAGTIRVNGVTTSTGDNVVAGTLLRVETMALHADSSYSFTGARANLKIVPSAGTNTNNTLLISSLMKGVSRLVNVYIRQSSSYHKRYMLYVESFGSSTAVNAATVVTGNSVDSLTIGSPTFTGNTDGSFNIVAPTTALTFTGAFSGGETSGTLNANWVHGTGVFSVTFSNGDKRQVTLTNAATTADWSTGGGALSGAATTAATASNYSSSALIYISEMQHSTGTADGGHIQY